MNKYLKANIHLFFSHSLILLDPIKITDQLSWVYLEHITIFYVYICISITKVLPINYSNILNKGVRCKINVKNPYHEVSYHEPQRGVHWKVAWFLSRSRNDVHTKIEQPAPFFILNEEFVIFLWHRDVVNYLMYRIVKAIKRITKLKNIYEKDR